MIFCARKPDWADSLFRNLAWICTNNTGRIICPFPLPTQHTFGDKHRYNPLNVHFYSSEYDRSNHVQRLIKTRTQTNTNGHKYNTFLILHHSILSFWGGVWLIVMKQNSECTIRRRSESNSGARIVCSTMIPKILSSHPLRTSHRLDLLRHDNWADSRLSTSATSFSITLGQPDQWK